MYFSITFHPISFTIISSYMLFFVFCLFQIISQEINGFFASSLLLVLSTQRSSTSEWSSSFFWSLLLSFFALLSYPQTHSNLPSIVFFFARHVLSTIILYHVCRERASNHQKKCQTQEKKPKKTKKILKLKTKRNFQQFIVVVCHKIKFHNFHRFLCVVRYI